MSDTTLQSGAPPELTSTSPRPAPRPPRSAERHGLHTEFVAFFERYLDAVYPATDDSTLQSGRWRLMRSIAAEMRQRGAVDVLDCAAGSGYPMLDLVADSPDEFNVHCSDGDTFMVEEFERRAKALAVPHRPLAPKRFPSVKQRSGLKAFVVDWTELGQVEGRYDYVLCRGNSLAYADTWTGKKKVANDDLLTTYLGLMAGKVRPGGHLHIDAPRAMALAQRKYSLADGDWIWEQVSVDRERREWWLKFGGPGKRTVEFKRYSSLLTIDRVQKALDQLGFEQTEPIDLAGERPSLGVIIARKPT